jgi:uncharacterized protein (TIGR02453 family)
MPAHFSPSLFQYLRDLKANNTRTWFEEHRARYVDAVEGPMLRFITDLAPGLRAISPAIVVNRKRFGGSLYRIYRDTRFSADKTPYKTHVAARFSHEKAKDAPAVPGFYLHLEPDDCMSGGGIYHPDSATLARVRLAIVDDPKGWSAVKRTGITIEGDRLKRAPAGFSPTHKFIEDLRMKDFYALTPFTERDVCSPDFMDAYVASCRRVEPLVAFLTQAMGWKW